MGREIGKKTNLPHHAITDKRAHAKLQLIPKRIQPCSLDLRALWNSAHHLHRVGRFGGNLLLENHKRIHVSALAVSESDPLSVLRSELFWSVGSHHLSQATIQGQGCVRGQRF